MALPGFLFYCVGLVWKYTLVRTRTAVGLSIGIVVLADALGGF